MRIVRIVDRCYFVLLLVAMIFVYSGWFYLTTEPAYFDRHWISFAKFYSIGKIIRSKDRERLYDPPFQREQLAQFVNPDVLPPIEVVNGRAEFPTGFVEHPPHFCMVFAPFSLMKPLEALWVYSAIVLMIGVASLRWLTRSVGTLNLKQTLVLAVAGSACFPGQFALMLGQPAWLLVALLAGYMAAWFSKDDRLAGVVLALSTIKAQYPIFLAVPAFVMRKGKLILWGFLCGCVLLLLCVLVVGVQNILAYVPMISRMNTQPTFANDDVGMPSLRGVIAHFFGIPAGIKMANISLLIEATIVSAVWWFTSKKQKDMRWAFAATVLTILLFSPHLFRYDSLIMLLPVALTLSSLSLQAPSRDSMNAATYMPFMVWRYFFLTYPITSTLATLLLAPKWLTLLEFISNLLLLGLAVRLWYLSGDKPNEPSPSELAVTN